MFFFCLRAILDPLYLPNIPLFLPLFKQLLGAFSGEKERQHLSLGEISVGKEVVGKTLGLQQRKHKVEESVD